MRLVTLLGCLALGSGATFTEVTSTGAAKSWRSVASSQDGMKLVAAVQTGNLWTSGNGGGTWTEDTSVGSTKDWSSVASSRDGMKLVAAAYNGNIWTSGNGGAI